MYASYNVDIYGGVVHSLGGINTIGSTIPRVSSAKLKQNKMIGDWCRIKTAAHEQTHPVYTFLLSDILILNTTLLV